MKYFTPSMWRGLQRTDELGTVESHEIWQRAFQDYSRQLSALRNRLSDEAYAFFAEADVHDGELLELRITDGSRPAPLSAPVRVWESSRNYPVGAQLAVLDAVDQFVWRLSYSGLRRTLIDFPGGETLFYQSGEGFGDWGYHELTDAGEGFLRHEVLFRSGATVAVEFREILVRKTLARAVAPIV
jgi:hypothetical protein